MSSYIPSTLDERQKMLNDIGCNSIEELFSSVPKDVLIKGELNIPKGLSEMEVFRVLEEISEKNVVFKSIFRGAGAYNHYIPSIVKNICSKEEFLTAYTPYQGEMSQGLLQSVFEYQTMICELTGMEVSNASVYDGATAAAEAVAMCVEKKRKIALVSETVNPNVIEVIKTYCFGSGVEVVIIPEKNGLTDLEELKASCNKEVACLYIQQPNYFGLMENAWEMGNIIHEWGGKYIVGCNPISLGIFKCPKEFGADVAVGEGQPLGLSLSFGGPYLGFMACTSAMIRKLPGRIVGQTKDAEGKRAFVLTMQAREQHIRREKASSNICSNQALCALTASVYMSAMGSCGLERVAFDCTEKAHYLADCMCKIGGFKLKYEGTFFNEFVTVCDFDTEEIMNLLENKGILGGYPLNKKEILWCVTEMNTENEIEKLIETLKEVRYELNI